MLRYGSFTGAILSIDGTLIKITKPTTEYPFDYYDRKTNFSLNFVCCVDYKLRFRAVTYGYGQNHDNRILRHSGLSEVIESINIQNTYVIGDSAFSGFQNIITPNIHHGAVQNENSINEIKKQRMTAEHAFGLFKNKFKRFDARIRNGHTQKNIKTIIGAMFIHNFIINNN